MKQMNWKTWLITAITLISTDLMLGQKVILNKTFDGSIPSETEFGEVTPSDIETTLWSSAGKFIFGGNEQYPKGEDAWFTYTASDLKVNATYTVEVAISKGQGWAGTSLTLGSWAANDASPTNGTVVNEALIADVAALTDLSMTNTFTATSTTMVFGIGMGRTNNKYYLRAEMNSWKITENPPAEYSISYHNIGSKNHEDNPKSYLGIDGVSALVLPYDSVGFNFIGWYTDSNMENPISTPVLPTNSSGDQDFYAKWEAAAIAGEVGISGIPKSGRTLTAIVTAVENNTGTLSYQWQSGNGTTFTTISGANTSTYTLTDNEVGQYIQLVIESNIQSGNLSIKTAQSVLSTNTATYIITYNANGGTDNYITSEEVADGNTSTLSGNPIRNGYDLIGWNTKADGSGNSFTTATTISTNITLYAQWEIVTYNVTFNSNGIYNSQTTDISKGRVVTLPNAPEKTGYTFSGWNTQADGRGNDFTGTTVVTLDMTVYAQWNAITYTVTFDAEGTYATKETTINSQYMVSLPEAPTKEGFTFKNWNTQADGLGATLSSGTVLDANITVYAQWREIINAIPIAINLNIKHSVDGVSDFGRERHITSHTSNTESDWEGHEDMMDYFFNELDVYGGRDNGSAGWKNKMVTEDPNKVHWPDLESIKSNGNTLKKWYDGSDHTERHQYEDRRGNMIMGLNPHAVYPSMDWTNYSKMNSGWQTYDVDAAAYFIAHYLDNNFAKTPNDIGEPMPVYWECMNEPDMAVMSSSAMFLSSFEKIYEFHNLTAIEIRKVLGDKAPKVGGFTWGQHDFWGADFINRWANAETTYYNYSDEAIYSAYDNMWLGYDGKGTRATGSSIYQARKENWWQWDALYQEFMETCGEQMDFYSFHFYDWPLENDGGTIRTGGPIEASLDMVESFDIDRFGKRKEAIVSEFGTVSQVLANTLPYYRRDWENLRPFNQMFMQFLERPSHLTLTMPFAPIKAIWGDWFNADGSLQQRYPSTMMDPVGDYKSPGYDHEEWQWSGMILWYELWKDVKGTRIDTKSPNPDIQVDAYVDGKHVYLILNNLEISEEYLNLSMFGANDNKVTSVKLTHQHLDENQTATGWPVNEVHTMASLPAQVKLAKSATMILDIEYENVVAIDEESKEKKYVSERLSSEKNRFGRNKYYVESLSGDLTTHINGVTVPTIGEATLRVGVRLNNGVKANVSVNGTSVLAMTNQSEGLNVRGRELYRGAGGFFCVIELDVPLDILKENNEIVLSIPHSKADISSVQLQIWDMTTKPGRFEESQEIKPSALTILSESSLMNGETMALEASFTPANTTNKALEWSSSNPSIISVDKYGVITANTANGNADITATSLEDGNIFSIKTISTTPFQKVDVTNLSISEGNTITVPFYTNTALTAIVSPLSATNQDIVWSSSDESVVYVSATGKVTGKQLGESATITASITDGTQIYTDEILVIVTVVGGEQLFTTSIPDTIQPFTESELPVIVRAIGERTIKLEISKAGNIVGQGEITGDFAGDTKVEVPYTLNITPEIDTDYDVVLKLYADGIELDTKSTQVYMADFKRVTSVTILDGIRTVQVGKTITLLSETSPSDAYIKTITWTSSDDNVATVNSITGEVKGITSGIATITATTDDLDLSTSVEILVQDDEVVIDLEEIILPQNLFMFPDNEIVLKYTLVPSWTTSTNLTWSTSDNSIASIDAQGKIISGSNSGNVTITASSSDGNVVAHTQVIIARSIIIQAEDFDETGGAFDGISIYDINDNSIGINNNQSGDWMEYDVYFPKTASYGLKYYIGATADNTDIGANLYIDGTLASTTTFSSTGSWDTMQEFITSTPNNISEGWHTVRIESTGSSSWQWNADFYEFYMLGDIASNKEQTVISTCYPNPADDRLFIDNPSYTSIKIFNMVGELCISSDINSNTIKISDLPQGMFIIELSDGHLTTTEKLMIER